MGSPDIWLGDIIISHEWYGSSDNLVLGSVQNVFLQDVSFLGLTMFGWNFQGRLDVPNGQLHQCCLNAGGKQHVCKGVDTHCSANVVHCVFPMDAMNHEDAKNICQLRLVSAKFKGWVDLRQVHQFRAERSDALDNGINDEKSICDDHLFASHMPPSRDIDLFTKQGDFAIPSFGYHDFNTVVIPKSRKDVEGDLHDAWSLLELFSGGFGGWKQSALIMNNLHQNWKYTLAVEIEHYIARMYCKNFSAISFDQSDHFMDQSCHIAGANGKGCELFRGDVKNDKFMKLLPWNLDLVLVMSPPCPPWCRSSQKNGLQHDDGLLFIEAFAKMRYLQPKAVAIENVDSICDHAHFPWLLMMLNWAGYKIIWQKICDLRVIAPIHRRRWLAVCVPVDDHVGATPLVDFIPMPLTNLVKFGVFVDLPALHIAELLLDDVLKAVYSDPALTQSKKCSRKPKTPDEVLNERIVDPYSGMNTMMAMYGAQHDMPRDRLIESGLFAQLTSWNGQPRFFSPMETAILHGVVIDFFVHGHLRVGHVAVGNCIATPQAALALAIATAVSNPKIRLDPETFVLECLSQRLHATNAKVIPQEHGWALVRIDSENVVPQVVEDCEHAVEDNHESDFQIDEACIDATISFELTFNLVCVVPDGNTHVYQAKHLETLAQVLIANDRPDLLEGVEIIDEELVAISLQTPVERDMKLSFRVSTPIFQQVVKARAAWIFVEEGSTVQDVLQKHHIDGFNLEAFDVMGDSVDQCVPAVRDGLITLRDSCDMNNAVNFIHVSSDQTVADKITYVKNMLPEVRISSSRIQIQAFDYAAWFAMNDKLEDFLFPVLQGLHAWEWKWTRQRNHDSSNLFGELTPLGDLAAPSSLLMMPLLKHVIGDVLNFIECHDGIPVALKFRGSWIWTGKLPSSMSFGELEDLLEIVSTKVHSSSIRLIFKGKRCNHAESFAVVCSDFPLRLHLVNEIHGGGGKIEGWKEVKALLGKELIQRGWAVHGLDDITTEWVRCLGVNRLLNVLKVQQPEKRWSSLVDSAKWHGLQINPVDPTRLRAVKTIQKAMRKKLPMKLSAESFRLCPDFFLNSDDSETVIINKIDMKTTGICLVDLNAVKPWFEQSLPLVSDELAVVVIAEPDAPKDVPAYQNVTFPAVDTRGRQVILRGWIWQFGQKHVKWSTHEHAIKTTDTIVLAMTVWKDECNEQQWNGVVQSMVKASFALVEGVDMQKQVLQVWGRSYRDQTTKCDSSLAISAQFHFRILKSDAADILKTSGNGPYYFTPKSDLQMSHPDWGLIWLSNKMEATIAAQRATQHAGLARSKNKCALRVPTSLIDQIAKEVRPQNPPKGFVPIKYMWKIEPVPLGVNGDQITEWACNAGWKIKVMKMLGKTSVLVGSENPPPQKHLCMNSDLVLIKAVKNNRANVAPSPLVAGPKPAAIKKDAEVDPFSLSGGDPWALYQPSNRGPASVASTGTGHTSVSRTVDPPTAAKFSAIEARLATFEQAVNEIRADQVQAANVMKSHEVALKKVDSQLQGMQGSIQNTVEDAIRRATQAQEKSMDQKFDQLMKMLSSTSTTAKSSRRENEDDDDPMESPLKQPPNKKLGA